MVGKIAKKDVEPVLKENYQFVIVHWGVAYATEGVDEEQAAQWDLPRFELSAVR